MQSNLSWSHFTVNKVQAADQKLFVFFSSANVGVEVIAVRQIPCIQHIQYLLPYMNQLALEKSWGMGTLSCS